MRLVWADGRFAWPFVVAVTFVCVSLVAVDLAWRVFNLPFDTLLLRAAGLDLVAAVAVILLYRTIARAKR